MEKGQLKRKSGLTVADAEAETRAIGDWLRITDKPLAREKRDREGRAKS